MYWKNEENDLCSKWVACDNDICHNRIYIKLNPKLEYMARSILIRYFNGFFYNCDIDQHTTELVNHTLLNMYKYDSERRGVNGWYSFCQTMIKNKCVDLLVLRKKNATGESKHKGIYFIDDYEIDIEKGAIDLSNKYDNSSIDIQYTKEKAILALENNLQDKYNISEEDKEFINLAIKFINEFDFFNGRDFGDYIYRNSSMSITNIQSKGSKFIKYSIKCSRNIKKGDGNLELQSNINSNPRYINGKKLDDDDFSGNF